MYLLGVLALVVGILLSIALHEIGHLVPAKRFGVKCTQYMVGFGPTVWSRRVGDTEYGVKAVPLGGYVRMIGMFPPRRDGSRRPDDNGRWALIAEQARQDAQREIHPEDADRLFYQRSVPKRLVIMLGGPVMNLVVAIVLLAVTFCALGVTTAVPKVGSVSQCILPAQAPADRACTPSDPAAPAAHSGLRVGDEVAQVNGQTVTDWAQVQRTIRASAGTPLQLVVRRDGALVPVSVTPARATRDKTDAQGNPVIGADGKPEQVSVGFLGVSAALENQRQPLSVLPGLVWSGVTQTAGVVVVIPAKLVGLVQSLATGSPRDPNGLVGLVGIGRLAGQTASSDGVQGGQAPTFADRLSGLLALLASLNIALFVFNMIPLLPLDGGHVAGALWEGLRRQVARLRRRQDPGPVDIARALPVAYGVASLLVVMTVLLVYADIVNPVS
jgi:membrane-associated protease RseP (regulator of RpoE activity)